MATYFHGTSEIQASDSNIQTLYLMNPNYLPTSQYTQASPNNMLLTAPPSQALVGTPVPGSHLGSDNTNSSFWGPPVTPVAGPQGLSLSLSPHQYGGQSGAGVVSGSSGAEGMVIVGRCKYLKVVQELLDEVVSVVDFDSNGGDDNDFKGFVSGSYKNKGKEVEGGGGGESKRSGDQLLTTSQRQDLHMKKAKLVNMLDEVEKRYKQYHTQMQLVISWFEQILGIGSAKSYTYLASKTVSRQFRCLKNAISSHIKTICKTLGEDLGMDESRLRFVDHHQIRQQHVLQQLGVVHHHNPWRPQRGLPERAVSVLRAWLFEHFLHPYPKDSDKHMLAKQTGLTRSQVSNWFINARVRLWKPMVEEMYMEEMKTVDQKDNNSNTNNGNNNLPCKDLNNDQSTSKANRNTSQQQEQQQQLKHQDSAISCMVHQQPHLLDQHSTNDMVSNMSTMSMTSTQGFNLIGSSSDMESLVAGHSPKRQRSGSYMQNSPSSILSMEMETKTHNHQINKYGQDPRNSSITRNGSGLNPYTVIPDIDRFNPNQIGIGTDRYQYHVGNNVSLSLGLPHCENFIEDGEFCGISMGQPSHPSNVYDSIDIQSSKRFASQLMHDFVA